MKVRSLLCTSAILLTVALCAPAALAQQPPVQTEEDQNLYALGMALSQRLLEFNFSEKDVRLIQNGLADGLLKREAKVDMEELGPKLGAYLEERAVAAAKVEEALGDTFREELAATEGAAKSDSGLVYIEQQAGTGASPAAGDTVKVHYNGTLRDGTVFDSSAKRGEPVTFKLDGVIPCFSEGIQKMKIGGKSRLICPPSIAYGNRGAPPLIRPGSTLSFEIELLGIEGGDETATP